jgi:cytochrome b561
MIKDNKKSFGSGTKLLHWLTATLFIGQYIWIGSKKYLLPKKSALGLFLLVSLHKPLGIVIILLGLLFIIWRLINLYQHPKPVSMPRWEIVLIRIVQGCLFLSMILVPLSGWIMSSAGGYPVNFFGFTLPLIVVKNKALATQWHAIHGWVAYIAGTLIFLHIAGGIKHHYYNKDITLARMLPWSQKI